MQISRLLTLLAALVAAAIVFVIGIQLVQPPRPLIDGAAFSDSQITPNADGDRDVAIFTYTLTRNATISITLAGQDGREYVFRDSQLRVPDDYRVQFSGIVQGYTLPDEAVQGEVETRLLPNGEYTWRLRAVADDGETMEVTGPLAIAEADSSLPDLAGLSVSPTLFTPNQDGIDDRVAINVYLPRDATLTMYLEGTDERTYVTEVNQGLEIGAAGLHVFDYAGGIDTGREPPDDGDYTLVALAEDATGQRVRRTAALSIRDGGYPLGAVYPQPSGTTVFYDTLPYDEAYFTDAEHVGELLPVPEGIESSISDSEVVRQGDLLVFRLTITNDGSVGLRTSGPPPGTVYQQEQRASGIGWFEQSGAWRVGLECATTASSYPWRWALAPTDRLDVVETNGETYYYLPPGAQAVVWGAVRLTEIVSQRNPQPCWIGLIHEDVAVVQADVDRRWVEIVPDPAFEAAADGGD
jgi:hypothetical protein